MDVFVIPTNRDVKAALESIILEIQSIHSKLSGEIKILIVDNSAPETALANRCCIEDINQNIGLNILHFDMDVQRNIVAQLERQTGLDLAALLIAEGTDYGKISNMIYISAVLLGGNKIHRRDSDCYVEDMAPHQYPVIGEIEYLGSNVNERMDEFIVLHPPDFQKNEELLIVGSDYLGNWNLDFEKLQENNSGALEYFLDLMGIPQDQILDNIETKYSSNHCTISKPVLKNSFKVKEYPECGNISMKDVFKWIPNFIGANGVGYDYQTQFMCFLLNVPTLYHPKKIYHRHDSPRKKISQLKKYWEGIIRQVDLNLLWTQFIQNYLPKLQSYGDTGLGRVMEISGSILPDALEASYLSMPLEQRLQKIEDLLANILIASNQTDYIIIAEYLEENKHRIISEMNTDYENSFKLFRNWRSIVEAAESLHAAGGWI